MRFHHVIVPCGAAAGGGWLIPALMVGGVLVGGRWIMAQLGIIGNVLLGVLYDALTLAAIGYGSVAVGCIAWWGLKTVVAVRRAREVAEARHHQLRPAPTHPALDPTRPVVALAEILSIERVAA